LSIFAEESLPARAFAGNPIALRAFGAGARRNQSMTRSLLPAFPLRATLLEAVLCGVVLGLPAASAMAAEPNFPITAQQRSTAKEVAQAGVPLSALAPGAPDSYTVKKGDTLWDISGMYLKQPWRWPELWGMNLEEIRNPHLIFPGQVLYLEKIGDRARLRTSRGGAGENVEVVRLTPQVRSSPVADALSSVNMNLIEPFLNEAVIFETNALQDAPRIVATTEDQVLLARGNLAYAIDGKLGPGTEYRIFREPRPLTDPTTNEVLGYEAVFLGTADYLRPGETRDLGSGRTEVIPATLMVTGARREIGAGDRLAPVPPRQFVNYVPHAPQSPIDGQIVSIYGEGLTAGKGQIVSLNRGAADGMQLGNVLALWRQGRALPPSNVFSRTQVTLPDERSGMLFVFRVFDRMSYALITESSTPVRPGDRFSEP
jgi:hypothetical protein